MDRARHKININTPDPGYEPFPVSIINRQTREVVTFDPHKGETATISYSLNKKGCIRVRIVLRSNPDCLITTLQDWTDQEFGKYQLTWDGRDGSGNIIENRRVFVLFEAKDQGKGLLHAEHDSSECCDPRITIGGAQDSLINHKDLLECQTTFCHRPHDYGQGCEVRYYVDYSLLERTQYPTNTKSFQLSLDTKSLEKGTHLLMVNVCDYNDHIGSASLFFTVEN